MEHPNFQTVTHAKAILAGEHAVLRGSPALVMPVLSKTFRLTYLSDQRNEPQAQSISPSGESLLIIFWHTIDRLLHLTDRSMKDIPGSFLLDNHVPIGAGLGFSAALCAAVSRWAAYMKWIDEAEIFNFARTLEDVFHGKSSGIDVAGALTDHIIRYEIEHQMQRKYSEIKEQWKPHLYLSFSKQPSVTLKCVKEVEALWESDKIKAQRIDLDMQESVELAIRALQSPEKEGLPILKRAIDNACNCFQRWNLVPHDLQHHIDFLTAEGALAAKPTGAGQGGYVLSLWKEEQDVNVFPFEMMAVG